jgi:predicted KAP-like P-loop ATPase
MTEAKSEILAGDSAKRSIAEDDFGLDKITESIASVLLSRISADGYTIGIEAEWGAGKSSLINFVAERLASEKYVHKVIQFQPWLIGTKETLLSSFFQLLISAIRDDLDRLDPAESVEILRLIKAVADFPILTYVVCFDREILAAHVKTVLKIEDGHRYIEKIFQAFLSLPPQEPFALRRHVRKLLANAFPKEFSSDSDQDRDRLEREQILLDTWCGRFIDTPRDAIRLCEAVKFGWPYIVGQADFLDYVWLQLIKLQCHDLYQWTRNYVVNIGSYRDGGRPGDDETIASAQTYADDAVRSHARNLVGLWEDERDLQ